MTDNSSNQLNNSGPKYRKKLNQDQVAILQLLWKFRFASGDQIAKYQQKPNSKAIQKRLKILEDQDLIAKRYDKSYRLRGKPAAYFLTPGGARVLAALEPRQPDEPMNIRRLYKDKDVSEGFIDHCKNVLSVYMALKQFRLDSKLYSLTKSQLRYERYDFMPNPLPDIWICTKTNGGDHYLFLDIFEDNQPFFVLVRRIKKYLKYASSGEWARYTGDDRLPTILLITQSESVHKRLRRRLVKDLREFYKEVSFATGRLEYILDLENKGKAWLPVSTFGDDRNNPRQPITLTELLR